MLLFKYLIIFLLLHLIIGLPQINLYFTEWIEKNTNDIILQHDCLHVISSTETLFSRDIMYYCMSELPSKWNIERNRFDQIFTFAELYKKNITSEQLYHWSAPMDIIEDYQMYLDLLSIVNVSSTLGTQLFYNCTSPRFGPQCQYSFDFDVPSHLSLHEIIDYYYNYYYSSYEMKTLTCYTHLRCNRGLTSICLDWSEICDGKVDCTDGIDEENCWPFMLNKCKNDEYKCDNGQCISKTFVNDSFNAFECLDRSDEERISSISSLDKYGKPTFKNEDVICSWRKNQMKTYLNKTPFTSSCDNQRHLLIEQTMFSFKSNEINNNCFLALKCHLNISIYDKSFCSDFCQGESCIKIIEDICPGIFYFPAVPIAYGHIYFAYTNLYTTNRTHLGQIPPEYICYNEQLCGKFDLNGTILLSFKESTCRPLKDFPISFNTIGRDLYSVYIQLVYKQLGHCNRIGSENFIICDDSTMYQCKNSSKCILKSYVGDGIEDCDYKDDEEQSTINELCLTDESNIFFKCWTTNKCIHRNQIEDGYCQCGIDMYGICDDENPKLNEIRGKITFSTICDSFVDLLPVIIAGRNHTDETDCEYWPCSNIYTRCDGFWNCPDGADEINCNPSLSIRCPPNNHICISPITNRLMCLRIEKANDGIIDCLGGIDEPKLCRTTESFKKEKKFHCTNGNSLLCIPAIFLCNGILDCEHADDEQFCNTTSTIFNLIPNDPSNTEGEEFFYAYFYNTFKQKSIQSSLVKSENLIDYKINKDINAIRLYSSKNFQNEQYCHRGLPLRVWLDVHNNLSTTTCLCPPSYYGDRCQYQNERISLTMQFSAHSRSQQILFVLIVSLIDDSVERIIHSYHQITYLYMRDEDTKFNMYLLYSNRPKDLRRQYAIHINIYEMFTLKYRGSLLIPVKFPFLPVERISVKLNMPYINNNVETCIDHQCNHGKCIRYLNDQNHITFCQCENGWSGQYCTIPHTCTCSSDSLCDGVTANNQSICVCPINKFGSRCLLTNNRCQDKTCQNGGTCIPSDEHSASRYPYVCVCRKGYSGQRCEISDTTLFLSFDKDIVFPSPSVAFIYFIHLLDKTVSNGNKTWHIICSNETSVRSYWSRPFDIALLQLSVFQYYLIFNTNDHQQSSSVIQTIYPIDRCKSINEIFNESVSYMHFLQRIKYYHLPCQSRSINISCFYDDILMCFCYHSDGQRLANCLEFNHHAQLDYLDLDNKTIEYECLADNSFNSSSSSTPASSSSSPSDPTTSSSSSSGSTASSLPSSGPVSSSSSSSSSSPTASSSSSSSSTASSLSSSGSVGSSSSSSSPATSSSFLPNLLDLSTSSASTIPPNNSGMSSVHRRELFLYPFILLFSLYSLHTMKLILCV